MRTTETYSSIKQNFTREIINIEIDEIPGIKNRPKITHVSPTKPFSAQLSKSSTSLQSDGKSLHLSSRKMSLEVTHYPMRLRSLTGPTVPPKPKPKPKVPPRPMVSRAKSLSNISKNVSVKLSTPNQEGNVDWQAPQKICRSTINGNTKQPLVKPPLQPRPKLGSTLPRCKSKPSNKTMQPCLNGKCPSLENVSGVKSKRSEPIMSHLGSSLEDIRKSSLKTNMNGISDWKNLNCMARALYDNVAESPDELPFCKGEILTVLEQNTAGLEGWWLCSLRGRQGICPGNRLRIIPGYYDTGNGLTSLSKLQAVVTPNKVVTPKRIGDVFIYDTPRPVSRTDILNYDYPSSRLSNTPLPSSSGAPRLARSSSMRCESPKVILRSSLEQYDSPRSQEAQYDCPTSRPIYDTPKPSTQLTEKSGDTPDSPKGLIKGIRYGSTKTKPSETDIIRRTPVGDEEDVETADRDSKISLMSVDSQLSTSSSASLQASESLSLSSFGNASSNRSSLESHDLYDIPPEPRRVRPKLPPREKRDVPDNRDILTRLQAQSDVVYDVPPQVSRENGSSMQTNRMSCASDTSSLHGETTELCLELSSARDMLSKLEQEVYASIHKFSNATNLLINTEEMKVAIYRMKETLHELLQFSRGSIGNANKVNCNLCKKLVSLNEPVESINMLIIDAWSSIASSPASSNVQEQSSHISSILTSMKENIRHLCSAIQTHSHLLFKKSPTIGNSNFEDIDKTPVQDRPLPDIPSAPKQWLPDYDYVDKNDDILMSLPNQLKKSYDNLVKQSYINVDSDHTKLLDNVNHVQNTHKLDPSDKQVLNFYGTQAKLHLHNLNAAIDAFLLTIENNQPPKVFIAHSKFVILGAHKIVYIGDTVHRNVSNTEVRDCVLKCANALCDAMKETVAATKTAALQFPSVTAVQAMVDAFVSISELANNLKKSICRDTNM